jgi:hypothetical protein
VAVSGATVIASPRLASDPCGFHGFIAPPRSRMITAEQLFGERDQK